MTASLCPRAKKSSLSDRSFRFPALRVYTVGDGSRFSRAMKAFFPTLTVEASDLDTANTVVSVASVFSSANEYCMIRISDSRIEIRARDADGARNAAAILAQLIRKEDGTWTLPYGTVEDWPDAPYRAMMLESSGRSWIPMDQLLFYIRKMALARMNVLQFHFMEDPGCTIRLDCYPDMHGYGEENLKYTKDEIRKMIAYADSFGISVTPFVEVLSHSLAFNHAADIACPGDTDEHMFAVCVGQEKTFEAIERVLAEVAELFPDPVIHIGADEYDMSAVTPKTVHWAECPHCRALSEKMGYTTFRELFLYGISRINRIVNKLGKVSMLWNADLKPGELPDSLDRNMIIHFYRTDNTLGKEKIFGLSPNGYAEDGFAVINSYYPETYMDIADYMNPDRLNGWSYLTTPLVSPENRASVIGSACCAWEKYDHFERTIPPAIFLFADRLWNAFGAPVPYDDAYGRCLTRLLFENGLPEDLNVFTAVGKVLPPLRDDRMLHKPPVSMTDPADLRRIESALTDYCETAADEQHLRLARCYLQVAREAVAYRESIDPHAGPKKERIAFFG